MYCSIALLVLAAPFAMAQRNDSAQCTPPPAGMVAWWSLDEAGLAPGRTIADLTGNSATYSPANTANNGTVYGGLAAVTGMVAGGFHFPNDRSQYVSVPHHADLDMGRGDFTIDAWVRIDRQQTNGVIVDKRDQRGNVGDQVRGYSFFIYGDHPGIQLADDSSGWYNWVAYNTVLQPGRWYLLAVTIDRDSPTGGRLLVDGNVVLTFDPRVRMGSLNNSGNLYIGKSDIYASAPFVGDIDEVELFKRALDPSELQRIYAAGGAGKCKRATPPPPPVDSSRCTPPPTGMIAWWSLDETGLAAGRMIADLTGNPTTYSPANTANNGTVYGNLVAVPGKVAGGFHFPNDRSQYVSVPHHADLDMGRGDFTIDAWVRIDRQQTNGVIVDKRDQRGNVGDQVRGYSFFIYGDHPGIQLADDSSGWYNWVAYNTVLQPGRWYLLAVTIDRDSPTGGRLLVDGNVVLTFDPRVRMGSLNNSGNLYIGKSDIYASAPFVGDIDEVELFKRALDPSELQRIYAAGGAGKCKRATPPPPVDSSRCTPPPASLVGWWSNDEQRAAAGSSIADLTGNPAMYSSANAANNGIVNGNVTSATGKVAGALRFGGTRNDFVRVPHHAELSIDTTDLSMDAWIWVDGSANTNAAYMTIVDKRQQIGNYVRGYSMYVWGNGNLGFSMCDNLIGFATYGSSTGLITPNRWHFVAVSVDRDRADGGRMYIDGRLVTVFDPRTRRGSLANTTDLLIGKSDLMIGNSGVYATVPFKGMIDELEIFRRALDSSEFNRIYNAGADGKCKGAVPPPPGVTCDSIWGSPRQGECCTSTIQLATLPGRIAYVTYRILPSQGGNQPSGTIRSITAAPCAIARNYAGTQAGSIYFDSCNRPTELTIAANAAGAGGDVCVELIAYVNVRPGMITQCRTVVCIHCVPVGESRCDRMQVVPHLSENTRQRVRLFTITNEKAPASPICSVAVAVSPRATGFAGGALVVDGVARSWPAASSNGYTMITSAHGLPATSSVQFGLAADAMLWRGGSVTVTAYHCDGQSCTMTYYWDSSSGGRLGLLGDVAGPGENLCASRLIFTHVRSPWSRVRTIGLRVNRQGARFLAITPGTRPCAPGAADCDDRLENVVADGQVAMLTLRRGLDSVAPNGRDTAVQYGRDLGVLLVISSPDGAATPVEIVYFDQQGRELGTDFAILCGNEPSGVTVPIVPGGSDATLRVTPNPARDAFTVAFTAPGGTPITVEVYDVLGRRLMTHQAGLLTAGAQQVKLNASELPGGSYFVRIPGLAGTARVEIGR